MTQTRARPPPAARGRFGATWRRSAPYRPLIALVLLTSTASFTALGVLSLFARDDLGASDTAVTVYFVVVALASMVVMLVAGRLSDRGRARRLLISASLAWLAAGYWVFASVRSYSSMLVVGVIFFCAIGVPNAQLLAYARDLVGRRGDTATSIAVIGLVRIVFSVGSFLGFASGGIAFAHLGARPVFRITAVLCLGCLVLSWYALRAGDPTDFPQPREVTRDLDADAGQVASTATGRRLLVALAVAMGLFSSGRIMQLSQLPILMRASLHAPLELVGLALAVPPLCELALMPVMAWAALRYGRGRVFLLGGAALVVYYGGLVFVTTPGQLLLLQVGYAVFGAATVMVGIDLAQRLMADRAGMATSLYLSHENIAVVHGSLVATVSVATLGHQTGFAVPGALGLVALALTVGLFVRHPDRFDLRRAARRPGREPSQATPTGA